MLYKLVFKKLFVLAIISQLLAIVLAIISSSFCKNWSWKRSFYPLEKSLRGCKQCLKPLEKSQKELKFFLKFVGELYAVA